MGISTAIRFASDARSDNVAQAKDMSSAGLSQLNGGKRVRGLTRLRNGNDDIRGSYDRISIPKFRSIFNFNRNAREILKEIFRHETCVRACAAGDDDDALCLCPSAPVIIDARHANFAALEAHSSPNGIENGPRLFEDFLEHEMLVATFF